MTSLFLVTSAFDNISQSIALIQKLRDKERVVVIALDFWAKKRLRRQGIPYKTPDEYLDNSICRDIDFKAIEMARTWYRYLGDKLTYKNIPLGQMAEYDFVSLFSEALGSVEIATRILSYESPSMIFLPQKIPQFELIGTDTMCCRTLPGALYYLAKSRGIPVTTLKPGRKAIFRNEIRSLKSRVDLIVREIKRIAYKMCGSISFMLKARGKNLILFTSFVSMPYYRRICSELEKDGNTCLDIFLISLPAISRMAKEKIKELHNLGNEFAQGEALNSTLIYNDVPLFEILNQRFQQFFHVQSPALVGYIEWAGIIIRVLKPDTLVVMDDVPPISRAFCRTFKHRGIPVLVIQHGAFSLTSNVNERRFWLMPLEAQRAAVWGNVCQEARCGKRDKTAECQVVVGNPKYDFLAEGYRVQKSEICHKLKLVPQKGIIVVATEWYTGGSATETIDDGEQFIRSTLRALKSFPEQQIVIKLHPGFHKKYAQIVSAIAEEEKIEVTITREYLWELLAISDLVIITESTVGLDAMIMDKPVVVVNINWPFDVIGYIAGGAALGAYSLEDIASVVSKVLNNEQVRRELAEARKRFVYEYAYMQDGKACRRLADLIINMIQDKRAMESKDGKYNPPGS